MARAHACSHISPGLPLNRSSAAISHVGVRPRTTLSRRFTVLAVGTTFTGNGHGDVSPKERGRSTRHFTGGTLTHNWTFANVEYLALGAGVVRHQTTP